MAKWLYERGANYSTYAMDWAAEDGNKLMVEYIYELWSSSPERCIDRLPCTNRAIDKAAFNGHLNIIMFLFKKGFPWSTNAMDYAAMNGHLYVVRWLHENLPLDKPHCTDNALKWATEKGHQNVVEWLEKVKPYQME